ncbi:MAG TPA: hypothetical protein VGE21_13815 [Flavobacteriales bacterium]
MSKQHDDELGRLLRASLPGMPERSPTLRSLFECRVLELGISVTNAAELMRVEPLTLTGIMDGTQKRVDYTSLIRIAGFLQVEKERVAELYLKALEENFPDVTQPGTSSKKVQFLRENFDLTALKKAGFLDSITDYVAAEAKLNELFGYNSIDEHPKPSDDVAFSAGMVKPKNTLARLTWISASRKTFETIDNPNGYSREALIEFFPQIRWHSTDVEIGLISIIRELYKLGVTVIYQPPLPTLHLRGATFSVHNKPCIALTDYKGFYPTLWFALIHELFHVIFDWEEIRKNAYHISEEEVDQLSVKKKEAEADDFARKYFFSPEKMQVIRPSLRDPYQVRRFAELHQVHESFVYVFHAYEAGKTDRLAWPRATRYNPPIGALLRKIGNPWKEAKPIKDFVRSIENTLYR